MPKCVRCPECQQPLSWGVDLDSNGTRSVYLFCGNEMCEMSMSARASAESLVQARENLEVIYREWKQKQNA